MFTINHFNATYPKDTTFSQEQLLQIKPEHVYNWLGKLAFGKVDFNIDAGDRPTKMRCSSLEMRKKQLSFFMPNHAPAWCEGRGNPTKHTMHTTLFQAIKKLEVRGLGADAKAKRALTIQEFYKQLEMLRAVGLEKEDYNFSIKYPAMALWQFHLIARIDDVIHFGMANPMGHPSFDFAMKTKVIWSKNVRDEAKCPPQISLASADR